jgi:hypothetical protein
MCCECRVVSCCTGLECSGMLCFTLLRLALPCIVLRHVISCHNLLPHLASLPSGFFLSLQSIYTLFLFARSQAKQSKALTTVELGLTGQ